MLIPAMLVFLNVTWTNFKGFRHRQQSSFLKPNHGIVAQDVSRTFIGCQFVKEFSTKSWHWFSKVSTVQHQTTFAPCSRLLHQCVLDGRMIGNWWYPLPIIKQWLTELQVSKDHACGTLFWQRTLDSRMTLIISKRTLRPSCLFKHFSEFPCVLTIHPVYSQFVM